MHELEPMQEDLCTSRPSDLRPLSDLPDWQAARGEPDIRGWAVFDRENEMSLGSVEDMLVSIEMAQAVFIIDNTGEVIGESDVDYGIHRHLDNRRILLPLDWVELDLPDNRVLFIGSLDQFRKAPEYDPESPGFDPYYDYWAAA